MGRLIVIEGACDGIGKTTQFKLMQDKLVQEGNKVISHHFPSYNEYQGKPVENYLKGEFGLPQELSPYFVNSLYATDRAVTWHSELKEKYDAGYTVLLDRYTTSSIIYQAALIEDESEKKKFMDFVTDYEYNKIGIPKPDSVIFLYAPFELATRIRMERKENDGVANDVHEKDLEFMKKVYDSAMFAADYLKWDKIKCDFNDQMKSIDEIHNMICRKLKQKELEKEER